MQIFIIWNVEKFYRDYYASKCNFFLETKGIVAKWSIIKDKMAAWFMFSCWYYTAYGRGKFEVPSKEKARDLARYAQELMLKLKFFIIPKMIILCFSNTNQLQRISIVMYRVIQIGWKYNKKNLKDPLLILINLELLFHFM